MQHKIKYFLLHLINAVFDLIWSSLMFIYIEGYSLEYYFKNISKFLSLNVFIYILITTFISILCIWLIKAKGWKNILINLIYLKVVYVVIFFVAAILMKYFRD